MSRPVRKVRKWTKKQRDYMAWLSVSKYDRIPSTNQEFGRMIGVTDRTLRRWKELPGFWDQVRNTAREAFRQHIADYYSALAREAAKGSFQHLRLALEMTGEIQPEDKGVNINIGVDDARERLLSRVDGIASRGTTPGSDKRTVSG